MQLCPQDRIAIKIQKAALPSCYMHTHRNKTQNETGYDAESQRKQETKVLEIQVLKIFWAATHDLKSGSDCYFRLQPSLRAANKDLSPTEAS